MVAVRGEVLWALLWGFLGAGMVCIHVVQGLNLRVIQVARS
jgi:hypothetical protein